MNMDFGTNTIEMVRAKVREFRFTVTDLSTNLPVDVTTWPSFLFIAKLSTSDADAAAVVSKSLGSGISFIDAVNGLCEVKIEPADTAALANARTSYLAQIQGRDSSGEPWALWQGSLILQPNLILAS